jgi:hypothetical protein
MAANIVQCARIVLSAGETCHVATPRRTRKAPVETPQPPKQALAKRAHQ